MVSKSSRSSAAYCCCTVRESEQPRKRGSWNSRKSFWRRWIEAIDVFVASSKVVGMGGMAIMDKQLDNAARACATGSPGSGACLAITRLRLPKIHHHDTISPSSAKARRKFLLSTIIVLKSYTIQNQAARWSSKWSSQLTKLQSPLKPTLEHPVLPLSSIIYP